ncbi:MAG TPA: HlyD family efflux transporter periplasmic adaptor subunit [Anaerolineales bacterium]|nr:HlyD family efflux transporter periplasmic adaptor subunit [Anaerolineales bacterium]
MKRIGWQSLVLIIILSAFGRPTPVVEAAPALPMPGTIIIQSNLEVVVASGVIAPARVSELGFVISALVRDIPVAEGESVQAGQTLMVLNTPDLEYAVIAAEEDYNARALAAELQRAERVKYVNPNTGKVRWYAIPREVYLKALAIADQSKAVWDSAAANLAQSTLSAPFDGAVVDVSVRPGETVQANQTVLVLADLNHLQITTTDLSERDIVRVKIGQSVNVYIEALDVTVTGKVIRISPISNIVGGDIVFPVTIELNEQPDGLLWGMTAEVEIQTK